MGRKNKKYQLDLHQQLYKRFQELESFGESKHEAKQNAADGIEEHIYSFGTRKTYYNIGKRFIEWVQREKDCTTLKNARKYAKEYLLMREAFTQTNGRKLSAWTLATEAAALRKIFSIRKDDPDYYQPPARRRKDIIRSRGKVKRDSHFSETANQFLVDFCKATGLRRSEASILRGRDLYTREQIEEIIRSIHAIPENNRTAGEKIWLQICLDSRMFPKDAFSHFIYVRNGKGGKKRLVPIVGNKNSIRNITERFQETLSDKKIFPGGIPSNADIHSYRADYAAKLYRLTARDISEIPYDRINKGNGNHFQSEVYCMRNDGKGIRCDKKALKLVSVALGHSRISVVASSYYRS